MQHSLIALGSDDVLEEYLDAEQRQTTKTTSRTLISSRSGCFKIRSYNRFGLSKDLIAAVSNICERHRSE
jgi:hypothetical protein